MKSDRNLKVSFRSSGFRQIILTCLAPLLFAMIFAGCSAEAKKSRLLERAKGFFDSGEYEKAKIEYLNVLRKDPKNVIAWQQLGVIWTEQGAPNQAFPFLNKAVELAPDNVAIRTKLALVQMERGQPKEARKEAVTILAQDPTNEDATILLVEAASTKEELDDAEQQLQKMKTPDRASIHLAAASLLMRRNNPAGAESEVQQALALDPKSVRGHLNMAGLSLQKKDVAKAGDEFKRAADLAPARSPAALRLVEFKRVSGAAPEAKALLQELIQKAPDYLPALKLQGKIALEEKKFDDALALLDNVVSRDPSDIEARLLQAQTLSFKGDVKKAITLLEGLRTAVSTGSKNPGKDEKAALAPLLSRIGYQLAVAYVQDANLAQGRPLLEQLVLDNPEQAEAVLLLARLNLGSGDAQRAVSLTEGLLKKHPDIVPAQLLLAEAYRVLGRLDAAAAVYQSQINASPKNAGAHFMLGMILRQKGALPEARAAFAKAQELEPDDLLSTYQLVELDIQDKDFAAAHQRVGVHLQKNPASARAHVLDGKVFAAQKDWDRAEAAFLKALEIDPNSLSAYGELIGTYMAAGKLPEAVAKLEARLVKEPDDMRALITSASIYEKLNEYPKARDAYEKILAKQPNAFVVMNNLAYLYAQRLNQIDKAYELALKARTLKSKDPALAAALSKDPALAAALDDTLGWILYKRGDYQQAFALLTDSAGKRPDNPEIQFHLGMAAYMMGQTEVARTALKLAAAAKADFPGKPEIQARLALLDSGSGPGATTMSTADLEAALKKQPDDLLLQTRLAQAYEKEGAIEKAVGAYEGALRLNPTLADVVIKLAQLYAGSLKNPDKALEFATKARALAPNDPRPAGILGALSFQAGDYPKAYGLLRESARGLPDDPGVLHDLAWATYSQGKVDEARKSMEHLLKVAPTAPQVEDATAFIELTALDQGAKDLVASLPKVESFLQKNPGHVPTLMARAAIHVERGEAKAAADLYTKVLARYPDFAPAQKWLASLYAADPANLQKGYDLAVKARKTLSDDPDLAETLGELAYQRKEFSYAVQLFQESARKRPLDAKGLYYLGKSHLATKKTPEGKAALEQALAAGLPEPLAVDVKAVIGELEKKPLLK